MAWRNDESVILGEIVNRLKGIVRGKLRLNGFDNPVKLDLVGDVCPDVASCLLRFKNLAEAFALPKYREFNTVQCVIHRRLSKARVRSSDKSQAGLVAVVPKKLLSEKLATDVRKELFEMREGILKLMDEFRGRA